MALSINLSNINNVQMNARALAQLNGSMAAERLSSGTSISSNKGAVQMADQLGAAKLENGNFADLRVNVIDTDALQAARDSRVSSSVALQIRERIDDRYPLYGVRCAQILAKEGAQALAEAQRGAASTFNTALSNQTAVQGGLTGAVSLTSGLQDTIQINDIVTQVNRGKRGNAAQVQANWGIQSFQGGGERGNISLLANSYNQLKRVDFAANNTAFQVGGGERGNISLLANSYNQLMRVDLTVANTAFQIGGDRGN
jgi:hypothetical protein